MSQKFHRRTILKCIAAVAASTAFGCSPDEDSPITPGQEIFSQSVASGDPRSDSVVLWTRAVDPANQDSATPLSLQVGTDAELTTLVLELNDLQALPAHDHTLKVKVTNLKPRTTYYYRFLYEKNGKRYASVVGRTRTAPEQGQDVPVRFVFASCQDFIGRYYNAWQYLLQRDEDLDFIVFLGDYIYETTGDTSFQTPDEARTVRFSDTASALSQNSGQYFAAAALSNYRDIYKTLRSDTHLRQLHERYPFIVVWDDHEFSDDSWGSTGTYSDGRADERSDERKRNAEQAFFEYIPLDTTDSSAGAIDVDSTPRYPATRIYRDFEYGKHLRLILTDLRTYRPDHLIPEDAYPGTVVMDDVALKEAGVDKLLTADDYAYVDIDSAEYAQQKGALQQAYGQLALQAGIGAEAASKAVEHVRGKLALAYVNQVLAKLGAPPISPSDKPRGLAYAHMGKTELFSMLGSRYVVVKQTFDLYSGWRYLKSQGTSENILGTVQESWLRQTVRADNTWKVVVSSVSLTSMVWNLSDLTDIPAQLRTRFYFNADQWDGFPNKRAELLKFLRDNNVHNALFISGDIHSSHASVEGGVPTLTTPAISSSSVKELASGSVVAAGFPPGSSVYRRVITEMESTLRASNPGLAFTNGDAHGFVVLEVRADEALATFHLIPSSEVKTNYANQPQALGGKFSQKALRVRDGAITDA
ncbi:alkaline phosphatase [Vitiosangium sp. GDMCC 1.1324]|uniref:alkaline phosphatase D family protein n=1 Tax=Vitiosangium sp. (strain GDMCC 1.1324) TaxID=2138576 RepID=UPI000D34CBA7|nr:alkaline phosphatase D family protein [Vitiosangium sp. GDMCC 1.1324]PTL78737.1 metallophosphatase [Vitiosangium sp. GDMCC 1.1324]